VLDHLAASIAFHGPRHGVRIFRKHLAAYVEAAPWPAAGERRDARARLCRLKSEGEIGRALTALWRDVPQAMAA
jgi:tRNA-dihydrouridine synthase